MTEPHQHARFFWTTTVALLLFSTLAEAWSQIADQVVIVGRDVVTKYVVARFDRKLNLLGETQVASEGSSGNFDIMTQLAPDANGVYWITFDPVHVKKLLRVSPDGQLLPSVVLGHNPVGLGMTAEGTVYALTTLQLTANGPIYKVSNDGTILWANSAAPLLYTGDYPDHFAVTSTGGTFVGGNSKGPCGCEFLHPFVVGVSLADGGVLRTETFPTGSIIDLTGSIDGALWGLPGGLTKMDGHSVLAQFSVAGGYSGATGQIRVNGDGDVWLVSPSGAEGAEGSLIRLFSQFDGSLIHEMNMGGTIIGFSLGPSGDDAFAVIATFVPPTFPRRLVRLNLVTGVRSTVPLTATFGTSAYMCNGDPTGFHFANVIDQQSDNDGDGIANGVETASRSNPFDPLSRPSGPKVFIDFVAGTNALKLDFQDPDGLVDPQGGLDISSLSLTIANYGNVFNYLWPFATGLDVSPDLTQASLTFGALPLPNNKKWQIEARVSDLTGAVGWDWQVTPPGDL
jgi:hypothetical protein